MHSGALRIVHIPFKPSTFRSTTSQISSARLLPFYRTMASVKDSIPHVVRTSDDPRQAGLHKTILSRIELVNQNIRVLRLSLVDGPARHLPGQYVDLHIPGIETVGGFTITSPPVAALAPNQTREASPDAPYVDSYPFVELAIQNSPNNPPAAYLYRDPPEILNSTMYIRVGGSFTYPPSTLDLAGFTKISNIVFIAGGVGINPIMGMLSSMDVAGSTRLDGMKKRIRVLYSSKRESLIGADGKIVEEKILFESRLRAMTKRWHEIPEIDLHFTLFETSGANPPPAKKSKTDENFSHLTRRISLEDLLDALGDEHLREQTLVYVCGHPSMTDEYVEFLRGLKGLADSRVLCEKWW